MASAEKDKSSVRVCCRFRPLNRNELKRGSRCSVYIPDDQITTVSLRTMDAASYNFTFDRVFGTNTSQLDMFKDSALPIVEDVLEGYNGCLLAYGQTGAGKTHTMMGPSIDDDADKGIIPRVVEHMFDFALAAPESIEFTFKCSMVEIYMEKIRDLLDPSRDNLPVKEDAAGGVYIAGCTDMYTTSVEETLEVMRQGDENRATAATGMNEGSSRSHSLFIVTLQQKNTETGIVKTGRFYLVDLAGSETVNKTGVRGQQLEEAKKINKSLSALGNVINSLTDGRSTHVPYRDSKLTRVLQEALGGNSRTALIINCSPATYNEMETLSTLRFGKRAKRISNKASINKERSPEEMKRYIAHLEKVVEHYKIKEAEWRRAFGGALPADAGAGAGASASASADSAAVPAAVDGAPPKPPGVEEEKKNDSGKDNSEATNANANANAAPGGDDDDDDDGDGGVAAAAADGAAAAAGDAVGDEDAAPTFTSADGVAMTPADAVAALVERNEELSSHVTTLSTVLQEALGEITSLKERIASTTLELEEARTESREYQREAQQAKASAADAQAAAAAATAAAAAAAASTAASSPTAADDADADADAGAGAGAGGASPSKSAASEPVGVPTPSQQDAVRNLRDNYHRALQENESLREEISELQANISSLEERTLRGRSGSFARDAGSPGKRSAVSFSHLGEEDEGDGADHDDDDDSSDDDPAEHADAGAAAGAGSGGTDTGDGGEGLMHTEAFAVWENERHYPLGGWTANMLPTDRPNFSNGDGTEELFKEEIRLPSAEWFWLNEWEIDLGGDCDENGWQYADNFTAFDNSSPRAGGFGTKKYDDYVRRRRWVRTGVTLAGVPAEGSRKHMMAMANRLSHLEEERTAMLEFNAKMAEELQTRLKLVNEYEEKLKTLQDNMAIAAATGNLKHIGAGSSRPVMGSGGAPRTIRGGGATGPRTIRGGSASSAGAGAGAASGAGSADDRKLGWLARFKKSFSPSKTPATMPAIFKAAEKGELTELSKMVSAGLSIQLEDKSGRTPLLYAARGGQLAAVEWLVEHGSDMNAMDKEGRNALHYAARRGHMEVAAWLLQKGVSYSQIDVHALTPLHQATLGRSRPLCELLLRHGADLYATDANGHTPLALAQRFEEDGDAWMEETITFLRQWAAQHPHPG